MRRWVSLVLLGLLASIAVGQPAGAITFGKRDGLRPEL